MPEVRLTVDDAVELAELLDFVRDWLNSPEAERSLEAFGGWGSSGVRRAEVTRFVFLLGGTSSGIEAPW
jgi:hypothetical protein